jgi:hypothetical protein
MAVQALLMQFKWKEISTINISDNIGMLETNILFYSKINFN